MSDDPYSAEVRALFAAPAHAGTLRGAATARVDDQGLAIELSAEAAGERIGALRFRAWGCPHVIAAAEAFCAAFEGRPVTELDGFRADGIMQRLAVPVEKTGRILVLEDAVQALGKQLRGTSG